jgi:orsellinic acid C2-O-methyltransferase
MKKKVIDKPDYKSLGRDLLENIHGNWITQAIYVFAQLRIADLLAEGPRTSKDLALITDTHEPSLRRLLRALTTIDICRERKDDFFEITAKGSLLGSDVPGSLRSWTIWWGAHLWPVWGNLMYSIKTGKSARKLLTGMDSFKYLEQNPEVAEMFNRGLGELTRFTSELIVQSYDFSGLKRIMDVGGGYGELLITILKAHPAVSGVLFDLPLALRGGKRRFKNAGLISRCEFVHGSFFDSVPGGADTYILKNIIHDWDNEKSKIILKNCRRAMAKKGRLLLIERVIPDKLGISAVHQAIMRNDLTMLVAHAAQERTEKEFRDLLNMTGFRVNRILPAGMAFSIIEAYPVSLRHKRNTLCKKR